MPGKKPTYTGRDATKEATGIKHEISIHAPRTGRDLSDAERVDATLDISIHAPHTGRDSTAHNCRQLLGGISIHAPHTGRDRPRQADQQRECISIHAPHTGRDTAADSSARAFFNFNPRAPYGARRVPFQFGRRAEIISIHAPHTGRDSAKILVLILTIAFQSTRPIRGATQSPMRHTSALNHFNPRAPYGARHLRRNVCRAGKLISIHAPHTGRD